MEQGASLIKKGKHHGEHYAVEMAPGLYFIPAPGFQQVEYDGANERRVSD